MKKFKRELRLTDMTAIGRPIDPRYPTNRAIAALAALVVVGGTVLRLFGGTDLMQALSWGLAAGLAVFLAWALGRELDPDQDLSAFVAAGLALVGLLLFGLSDLGVLFWVLVLLRIVNRTVGLPAKLADSLLLLGLGSWLALQGNWIYGLMTALAFFLDSQLARPHRRHLFFASMAFVVTVVLFVVNGSILGQGQLSLPATLVVFGMAALFVPVVVASRRLRAVDDAASKPLDPKRVQAAQVMASLTAIQIALWDGNPGVVSLIPLWATMLGATLYRALVVGYRSTLLKADDTRA